MGDLVELTANGRHERTGDVIDLREPHGRDPSSDRVATSLARLAVEIEVLQQELARLGTTSPGVDRLASLVDALR